MSAAATRPFAAALLAALTAACSRDDAPEKTPEIAQSDTTVVSPAAAPPVGDVGAYDQVGVFKGPIAGLELWAHPTLPYRGAVVVATAGESLELRNFDGDQLDIRIGGFTTGLDVVYFPDTDEARGAVVARDDLDGAYQLFEITALPIEFRQFEGRLAADADVSGFCALADRADHLVLFELTGDDEVRAISAAVGDGDVAFIEDRILALPAAGARCAVDPASRRLFVLSEDGSVHVLEIDGVELRNPERLVAAGAPADDISLALQTGGRGQIALMRRDEGVFEVLSAFDGTALGSIRLTRLDTVPGVETPGAFVVAYGNYGSIYRDGALVVSEFNAAPAVRLTPWNAVANRAGFALYDTLDPRRLGGRDDAPPARVDLPPLPSGFGERDGDGE